MIPTEPPIPASAAGAALAVLPAVARAGSKPGMVLGLVTGVLLSVLAVALASAVGVGDPGVLVVAVPAAFVLGFLLVGGAVALGRGLT